MAISVHIMHMPEADKTLTYSFLTITKMFHYTLSLVLKKKRNWEQPKCPSMYKLKECLRYSIRQGEGKLCVKYSPFW